jgi:hypothetical protein
VRWGIASTRCEQRIGEKLPPKDFPWELTFSERFVVQSKFWVLSPSVESENSLSIPPSTWTKDLCCNSWISIIE